MTRQQIRGVLLALPALPALSTLVACAATAPGTSVGSVTSGSSAPSVAAAIPVNGMKAAYGNYVRLTRNGQVLYCDKERDTGTRMIQETCLTQAQMQAQQENARTFMQDMQGIANTPVSGPNVK